MRKRRALALLGAVLAGPIALPSPAAASAHDPRPSVVVIYVDDQRADQFSDQLMPEAWRMIAGRGTDFSTAIVPNGPLCCPSRVGMLTGTYSHTNGVWDNKGALGGFGAFDDASTLATWLGDAGYETGLFGKYLNGYRRRNAGYIPPGWDEWRAFTQLGYDPALGSPWSYSDGRHAIPGTGYATDWVAEQASEWIRSVPRRDPLLAVVDPFAPHGPTLPAPEHVGAMSGVPPYRPPSLGVVESDKPAYVQELPEWDPARIAWMDARREKMLEVDLSIDQLVSRVVAALKASNRLQNTLIVYSSDNGYMLGEHRLLEKAVPYDAAARVPLAIRANFLGGAKGVEVSSTVATIDIAPTAAEVAGVTPSSIVDGESLVPILRGDASSVREDVLIEHMQGHGAPGFCAGRSTDHLFVHYQTGEEEAYDYTSDPFELSNLADDPDPPGWIASLRDGVRAECSPLPPGFGLWPG